MKVYFTVRVYFLSSKKLYLTSFHVFSNLPLLSKSHSVFVKS